MGTQFYVRIGQKMAPLKTQSFRVEKRDFDLVDSMAETVFEKIITNTKRVLESSISPYDQIISENAKPNAETIR